MDFDERAIPGITSNFLMMEAMSRYYFALKYCTPQGIVLDIASGVGYGTSILAQKAKMAVGMDINKEVIAYAQQNYGKNSYYLVGDAGDIPFKDGFFDVVVAFEMIEHLKNPTRFLNEVRRVLKKDGSLIISTPNSDVHSPDGNSMSPFHVKEYNFSELNHLIHPFFKQVEFFGQIKSPKAIIAWKSFMVSQTARRSIVFLDIFGLRKLITKQHRENLWKIIGNIFGRRKQEGLSKKDFPVRKYKKRADYFIIVCKR